MANPQDLEKLCQGPKVWNVWRTQNSERIPDLRGARLNLSQRQFGVNHGGPVDLSRTDLEGAELRHANLAGADLQYARLVAADLVHAQLAGADLSGADLTDAVLDYADLTDAELDGAILVGASFANVRGLTQEQIAVAHGDASTVLPAMLWPPESWYPPLDEDMFGGSPAPDSLHNSDPYELLRVSRTATQDEIRTAFRNLVKLYHPDLNPGDSEAQEVFKRLSIAYRVLGDADKRARYDRGEIGDDGEVSPDYEARQHFRRHAFRIYGAAAASLVVAIGALAAVWYSVLTHDADEDGRVRIAIAGPPKLDERLPHNSGPPVAFIAPQEREQQSSNRLDEEAEALLNAKEEPGEAESPEVTTGAPLPAPTEGRDGATDAAEKSAAISSTPAPSTPLTAEPSEQPAAADKPVVAEGGIPAPEGGISAPAAETGQPPAASVAEGQPAPPPVEGQQVANLQEASQPGPEASKHEAAPASDSASVPAESDAAGPVSDQPPAASGAITPPLGEQHSGTEARPAQADAARSVTTDAPQGGKTGEPEGSKTGSLPAAGSQARSVVAKAGPGYSPHSELVRDAMGRKIGTDPVAALLWAIVTETKAAPKRDQTTGSVGPLLARDHEGDGEEILDLYRHSPPGTAGDKNRRETGLVKAEDRPVERKPAASKRTAVSVPVEVKAGKAMPPEPSPGAAFRERTVSDVLAGGL